MRDMQPSSLLSDEATLHAAMLREAERVLGLLQAASARVVTAESCTGGLVASALTHFPGSSDMTEGGLVTYSNTMKKNLLGVPNDILAQHGAVSEPTVLAMVRGALSVASLARLSVAISGIAGPGGGSAAKPVGLVWFAVADRLSGVARAEKQVFSGTREQIRLQAAQHALTMVAASLSAPV
jgi:nicotinamide-nucleotide amidase